MSAVPEETISLHDQNQVQIQKLIAETARTLEEVQKTAAETRKLNAEAKWHPVTTTAALFAAAAAFVAALSGVMLWVLNHAIVH